MRTSLTLCAISLALLVPAIASADEDDAPRTRMASPGLMAGGIALTSVGATAMPVGILFAMIHSAVSCGPVAAGGCSTGPDGLNVFGWSVIAGSSVAILGGITMIVFGTRQVPVSIAAAGPSGTPGMTLKLAF